MPESKATASFFLKFAVAVSVFGLVSIPLLLQQSDKLHTDFLSSKPLIGSLYAGLCILGISAIFFPRKCEESFIVRKQPKTVGNVDQTFLSKKLRFEGHHPDCEEFSANRIKIQRTVFCSACTGLFVGAIVALIGTLLYFFVGFDFIPVDSRVLVVGYVGLLLGLVQFKFRGYAKLMANLFFVLGSFITLIAADLQARSLVIDLYVLGLIVFLLLTRILISEWNNTRTCVKCKSCRLLEDQR